MKEISSKDNRLFKKALSLKKKKYRDIHGAYMIEGPNLIAEALREGKEIEAMFVRPDFDEEGPDGAVLKDGRTEDITYRLSSELFNQMTDTETPQGIAAIVSKPDSTDPVIGEGDNIVILDRLQDPGNIGTILRTADAAGYSLCIFIKGTCDPFSPKVVRSAAGSIFRVPMYFADSADDAAALVRNAGKTLCATSMEGSVTLYECDLSHDVAIVIGNEGNGVDPKLIESADLKIRIPMEGRTESLNASVACGILMYERIRRQNERSTTANP